MKETELNNTSETSEMEVQNLSGQDKARKHRKTAKAAISFVVMIVLLVALFFAAVNIGSLKVSFPELLKGLFVKYNEDVATIYDLRFPRIVISMLAGAAIAVSGVLFQAVLKNPLADPGIIGISSGASFAAVLITAFAPTLFFFTPLFAFLGGVIAFVLVYSLSWKGGLSPLRIILVGVAVDAMFTGLSSALNSMNGGNMSGVAAIVNGNITMKTWDDVKTLVPYVIVGLVLALIMTKMCRAVGDILWKISSTVILQPDCTTDIIYHSLQSEPESECDPADLCTADPDFNCSGTESSEEIIK